MPPTYFILGFFSLKKTVELPDAFFKIFLIQIIITDCLGE